MNTTDVLRYVIQLYRSGDIDREGFETRAQLILSMTVKSRIEKTAKQVLAKAKGRVHSQTRSLHITPVN